MRFSVLLAGLATSLAFSSPVLAESDLDQCKFVGTISKADQGIAACDRVIQDSKVTGPARAAALSNRCGWWWAKKDPDHALADCNEAIKVTSTYAPAYINRGNAYLSKGDFEHAFVDFNEAIPSIQKARGLTAIGAICTRPRVISITRWPTSTRQSSSTPTTLLPISSGVTCTSAGATSTGP